MSFVFLIDLLLLCNLWLTLAISYLDGHVRPCIASFEIFEWHVLNQISLCTCLSKPLLWGVPVIPKTFDFSKMSLWKLGVNASFSSIPFSQNLRCFGSSSENPPKIFSSCAQAPTLQDFRFGFTNSIWQEDSPQKRSYYYYYSLMNSNLTFHISYQHNTSTQHSLIYLQQENLFLISHYVFIGSSFHSHFLLYFFVSIW